MKKLLILLFFVAQVCYAQQDCLQYNKLIMQADSMYFSQNYKQASELFSKAFVFKDCIKVYHWFNAASVAAMAGDKETAFERLYQYMNLAKNWYSETFPDNKDFINLHSDPRWQTIIDTLTQRQIYTERNFDKPLRNRLKNMMKRDQEIRYKYLKVRNAVPRDTALFNSLASQCAEIDRMNLKEVCRILDSCGWVGKEKVGDACDAFWIVIQHSGLDIQKKYFPMLREAAEKGDISLLKLAMLEDRIAIYEGRPQKYGTQIRNGGVAPLVDSLKVDEWRKEVGMEPIGIYLSRHGIKWKTK